MATEPTPNEVVAFDAFLQDQSFVRMRPVLTRADIGRSLDQLGLPRGEVVSKVWEHIKKHNLQNPENKREIIASWPTNTLPTSPTRSRTTFDCS